MNIDLNFNELQMLHDALQENVDRAQISLVRMIHNERSFADRDLVQRVMGRTIELRNRVKEAMELARQDAFLHKETKHEVHT